MCVYIFTYTLFGSVTTYSVNTVGILTKGAPEMIHRLSKNIEHLLRLGAKNTLVSPTNTCISFLIYRVY